MVRLHRSIYIHLLFSCFLYFGLCLSMGNGDSFHTETCAVLQATINRDAYVTQSLAKSGKDLTNLDPDDAVDALQMRAQAVKYKDILPNIS